MSAGKLVLGATPRTVWMPWYMVSSTAKGPEARVPVAVPFASMPVGIATLWALPALELKLLGSVKEYGVRSAPPDRPARARSNCGVVARCICATT